MEFGSLAKKKKKIKGSIPSHTWLSANGFGGLNKCMLKYPELFKHMEQDKKIKTIGEWISIAEGLVEKNNGVLPNSAWLQKNGYFGLDRCTREYPELFKHMEQDKKVKMIEEWISIAEELAEKNDGILPSSTWLRKNRYFSIQNLTTKFPEKFSHIKQDRKRKAPEEWAEIAEALAKENNGKLPGSGWLTSNGYVGLDLSRGRHPELFKHIKIERTTKTGDEWLEIAKKIAKDNSGILPYINRLKKICSGLHDCMYRHPEIFKGMKQEHYIGRSKRVRTID